MPVKFGPEGYSSPGVRRFQEHRAPELDAAARTPSARRARPLGLALTIAVMLGVIAYLGRAQFVSASLSAPAKVVARDTVPAAGGGLRHVLGLSIPMPNGERHNVVIECPEEQWRQFQIGDEAVARYTLGRSGDLTVVRLDPKPAAIEL